MTLREYLLHETESGELCVIRDSGYIVEAAYIDHEDLFIGSINHADKIVQNTEWGFLEIYVPGNPRQAIPVHYINI